MAINRTMTTVGSNGYTVGGERAQIARQTANSQIYVYRSHAPVGVLLPARVEQAPEVLRGEHYGTPADVFSFGIVMSELVSLRSPYADMLMSEEGKPVATWEQLTEMSKSSGLRVRS